MNKTKFFKRIRTAVLTPECASSIMAAAVAELVYDYNFLSESFWAVTDNLYGRKDLLVAVRPLTLKEDNTVKGCLFFVPEFDVICFWYGSFACEKIQQPGRVFTMKLDDGTVYGKVIEHNGQLSVRFWS